MKRFLLVNFVLLFLIVSGASAADLSNAFGKNFNKTAIFADYEVQNDDGQNLLENKVGTVISSVLSFLGVIFIVLMFYGGFLWMSARGNEQQIEKARNVIIPAIIGLVIVLSAYAISYFVIKSLTVAPTTF